MRRRLFNIAAVVSLLLSMTFLLWIPFSYWFYASVEFPFPRLSYVGVKCVGDVVEVTAFEGLEHVPGIEHQPVEPPHSLSGSIVRVSWLRETFGQSQSTDMLVRPKNFQFSRFVAPDRSFAFTMVALPMWLLALIALLWPAGSFFARRRRLGRLNRGLCPSCGYNLTANTSGVCPECGTPITKVRDKSPQAA